MPKIYVCKNEDPTKPKLQAYTTMEMFKAGLRACPNTVWAVKVYDFDFSRDNICKYTMGEITPVEQFRMKVTEGGQVRKA